MVLIRARYWDTDTDLPGLHPVERQMQSFWLFSLPLKHREIKEQSPEVISQDRQIIFSYLRDKLVVGGQVCHLYPMDLPQFKVLVWYLLLINNNW